VIHSGFNATQGGQRRKTASLSFVTFERSTEVGLARNRSELPERVWMPMPNGRTEVVLDRWQVISIDSMVW
jgi:hypothetical protein